MKTFADAKFSVMTHPAGICGKIMLDDNGLEISIAMNEMTYGGRNGLWEVAVFDSKGQLNLDCLEHDVLGYLDFNQLEEKIIEIQKELSSNAI